MKSDDELPSEQTTVGSLPSVAPAHFLSKMRPVPEFILRVRRLGGVPPVLEECDGSGGFEGRPCSARSRHLESFLEDNPRKVRALTTGAAMTTSLLLSSASAAAKVSLLTTADASYTIGALALDLAVPNSVSKTIAARSIGGVYGVSKVAVNTSWSLGSSMLSFVPWVAEPVLRYGLKGVARIGDQVHRLSGASLDLARDAMNAPPLSSQVSAGEGQSSAVEPTCPQDFRLGCCESKHAVVESAEHIGMPGEPYKPENV